MHFINLRTKLNLNGTYVLKTFRNFQVLVQYLEQRKIFIITSLEDLETKAKHCYSSWNHQQLWFFKNSTQNLTNFWISTNTPILEVEASLI